MFIAILDFATLPSDRQSALGQLQAEQPIVRAMPGCLGFRAFVSPDNGTDITVLHEWEDAESFAAYVSSEAFARSGQELRPMMTGTPISRRFSAQLMETVA